MKIMKGVTVLGLAVIAMTLGSTNVFSQDACDYGGNHTIQVRPGDDGVPVLTYKGGSAENVYVCMGDQVQWVLAGSDRDFLVEFFAGAPFEGAATRGSSSGVVAVTIGGGAERGKGYDYNVAFADGGELDPRIIVE
jgi:hypothetical protein